MKICILAGAESIHIIRWVEYFTKKNNEVHLISFSPWINKQYPENLKLHLIKVPIIYRILDFISNKILHYTPQIIINIYGIQVRKILKTINPDILHAHFLSSYGIIGALADFHPLIISIWGSDVLIYSHKYKSIKKMELYALRKADIVTTIPEFMKDYITKLFGINRDKVIRIPWGIDLNIFFKGYINETELMKDSLKISRDSPIILSNRAMTPLYNIKNIISAVPEVLKVSKNAVFIFMKGSGNSLYFNEIQSLAENLGITDNVRFIQELISPEKMAVYLNMADMIVSIPKTDQFASSIMEGMACGVIPIVGNLKVYEQYLTNNKNAFFTNPENPIEIAQKIIYCIKYPEIKEEFYKINSEIIKKYENWDINANKMYKLYTDLLTSTVEIHKYDSNDSTV